MTPTVKLVIGFCLSALGMTVAAEVSLDGSMGVAGAIKLTDGNTYRIDSTLGRLAGGNLFHSFGQFGLETGTIALFTDSSNSHINNVIGRVTGGEPSTIDGTIKSTIGNADFYLINPAGMLFGANAKLDVPGAFYASTASNLKMGADGDFSALTTNNTVLSSAAPTAFGFLGNEANIELQGSRLVAADNASLHFSAAAISLDGATINTNGGQTVLTAVGKQADVLPLHAASLASSAQGALTLTDSVINSQNSATGQPDDVTLQGGTISLTNSGIYTRTDTAAHGGDINVSAGQALNMTGSWLDTITYGSGNAGNVTIVGDQVALDYGWLSSRSGGSGDTGAIYIKATDIYGNYDSEIYTLAAAQGNAGNIELQASQSIAFTGGLNGQSSGVFSESQSTATGSSGNIRLVSPFINWSDGAQISTSTSGNGNGGNITLQANDILLDRVDILDETYGPKDAGRLQIDTGSLLVLNGTAISGSTYAGGRGANIDIHASQKVTLQGYDPGALAGEDRYSSILVASSVDGQGNAGNTAGQGHAGNLSIDTPLLQLEPGTYITLPSFSGADAGNAHIVADQINLHGGWIESNTYGSGQGGTLQMDTGRLSLADGGLIRVETRGDGNAGNLIINASDSVSLSGYREVDGNNVYSAIDSRSLEASGRGGTVLIKTPELNIDDGARLSSTTTGAGSGGSITLNAGDLSMNQGHLYLDAYGSGKGGTLTLNAKDMTMDDRSDISAATYGVGDAGNVNVAIARNLTLLGDSSMNGNTSASGAGAQLDISAKNILLDQGSYIQAMSLTLPDLPIASGPAGSLSIQADTLQVLNGSMIANGTADSGNAGKLTINANDIKVAGWGSDDLLAVIATSTTASGAAGVLYIGGHDQLKSHHIVIGDGGKVSSFTQGSGDGGNISLLTEKLSVDGGKISTNSELGASGRAGTIDLNADRLSVTHSGLITSAMFGENPDWLNPGNADGWSAGNVNGHIGRLVMNNGSISTNNSSLTSQGGGYINLELRSAELRNGSSIVSETSGSALGGNIQIGDAGHPASRLSLSGGSLISTSALAGASGDAGSVEIFANNLDLDTKSQIASLSQGGSAAGAITVNSQTAPGASVNLRNGSQITVDSKLSDAGAIEIYAKRWVYLFDSAITTSAAAGQGNGGNILIDPQFVILNNSRLQANALFGNGGNINITTDFLLPSTDSVISASSAFGVDGTVAIQSQYSNIASSIAVLPSTMLDSSNQLHDDCAAAGANASAFTVGGRGGLPLIPDNYQSIGLQSLQCGSGL